MAEEFQLAAAAAAICGDNYWWNNNMMMMMNYNSTRSMFPLIMFGSTCSVAANNNDAAGNYSIWKTDDLTDLKATTPITTSMSCSSADHHHHQDNFATSLLPFLDANNNIKEVPQQQQSEYTLFRRCSNGRPENNFHSLLQEETDTIDSRNNNNNNSHQIIHSSSSAGQASTVDANFKPIMNNQEQFPTDQQISLMSSVTSSTISGSGGLIQNIGSSVASYGGYPSTLMQGMYEPDPHHQPQTQNKAVFNNPCMSYSSSSSSSATTNYGGNTSSCSEMSGTWSTVSSLMKPLQQQHLSSGLHFSNNTTPFWNASADAGHDIIRPGVFSSSSSSQSQAPPQYQLPTFDDKSNCASSAPLNNKLKREESPEKVAASATAFKRPRIETPSHLSTFKVRKEKLGDRITALQQLVSPFGKTDTASVLHEAIEYIKFLHDQVNVLSTPYMKNETPIPHLQGCEKNVKEPWSLSEEGGEQDYLRSRGLCLVPISSTFPMATETTADFWTPTFGGGPLIGGR